MEDIAPMIALLGCFVAASYITKWLSDNKKQRRMAEMNFELHTKLLDRFGTSTELMEYLGSDTGQQLLNWVPLERSNPYGRILTSLQWGIVLLLTGIAFYMLRGQISDAFEPFTVVGVFGIALGVGFLLSAAIAYGLSRTWGLINGETPHSSVKS
jgi:hypothetical protein